MAWHHAAAIVGLSALAALAGGMVFFGAVVAPEVFRTLEQPLAGRFIRALFPRYYRFVSIAAAVAAIGLSVIAPWCAVALAVMVVTTLWLWRIQMPRINRLRDARDDRKFARAHRFAVVVNQAELILSAAILVRLAFLL
ncbi:MAG: DUF4149 domain-containing protein [Acetobacteraceae bacterium]